MNIEELIVDAGINKVPASELEPVISKLSKVDRTLLGNQIANILDRGKPSNPIDLDMYEGAKILKGLL